MNWLLKRLMPGASKLAGYAADGIAKGINECGKTDTISRYSTILQQIAQQTVEVNAMLVDGKIDTDEKEKIKEMITPLFEKVMELI